MTPRFDAIVIGSGFGGAVIACRLAEKGLKVLVLERGRRWTPQDYPRKPHDPWLFNSFQPARQHGWLDLQSFKHMTVVQAAGVGGGSLAYSSVALEAHPSVFADGWPTEITADTLKPDDGRVSEMMALQTVPDGQLTQRFKLAREAAGKLGYGDRVSKAPLAVSFSPEWSYDLADPFDSRHSRGFTNAQGQQQGTCIHLGNCDIGCDVGAKNTLDLNDVPRAEQLGADIRPLHLVRVIEPVSDGYRVSFDRIEGSSLVRGYETAARVFLSAGSLGSTELLLRCRDQYRTLPHISDRLGHGWSANANVLSMATYPDGRRVQQTIGPTISGVVDFMDGHVDGQRFVIEDDGFPNVLINALRALLTDEDKGPSLSRLVLEQIEAHVQDDVRSRNLMVWLGAGMDAADGRLSLRFSPGSTLPPKLDLSWTADRSTPAIEAMLAMHRRMTEATGGRLAPNAAWSLFKSLITLHPLGGCRMGTAADSGVVDHLGRAFAHPNLFVVDGSIVPSSLGRNPSHTIAALAERIAEHVT